MYRLVSLQSRVFPRVASSLLPVTTLPSRSIYSNVDESKKFWKEDLINSPKDTAKVRNPKSQSQSQARTVSQSGSSNSARGSTGSGFSRAPNASTASTASKESGVGGSKMGRSGKNKLAEKYQYPPGDDMIDQGRHIPRDGEASRIASAKTRSKFDPILKGEKTDPSSFSNRLDKKF